LAFVATSAATALAVAGCPSRDLSVEITAPGASTLVTACESFRAACDPSTCHMNQFLCTQDTCELRQACVVGNNPAWNPAVTMGMRLLLMQVSSTAVDIKSATTCVPLNLRPCILDPTSENGCPCIVDPLGQRTCGAGSDPNGTAEFTCIADTLAEAVAGAMGSGLGFSGFTSTDGVVLAAALYVKPGDEATCDGPVLVNPSDCATANMTAVAGLGQTLGSTTFDITCASCQGGEHDAYGPDNAPCPDDTDQCFLQRVAAALDASGM
jgi:hypothetical protein